MEPTDHQLLAAFRERQCESSFRQLVARHAAMVFATARRIIGDPHRAEEVSQGVFLLLASKAGEISGGQPVAGWLYHTTRHRSLEFLRSETRRQNREQIAADMQSHENAPLPAPLTGELEAALADLQPEERDVLVLRYLEDRQLREVGCELGISEQAAQKRVARALESLRGMFERRGITLTSGALATLLAGEAAAVVPPTLIASATAAAVGVGAAAAAATTITQGLSSTMNLFNLKTAAAIVASAAVTGTTTYFVQEREADRLRAENASINESHGKLAAEQQEARELIHLRDEQIAALTREVADLPRLRGEVDGLRRQLAELIRLREQNEVLNRQLAAMQRESQNLESVAANEELERQKELEKQAGIRRLTDMHQLGLALIQYSEANSGWFPDGNQFASLIEAGGVPPVKLTLPWGELKSTNIALVYQGRLQDLAEPARTIVVRQLDFTASSDGQKINRAYGFADGHSEIHAAASLEELTNWEDQRIIPLDEQARRP